MYWVHPSSLTAWSRKYLPDGSSKSSISAGLDKPDDGRARRTGWQLPGGHVLAARRPPSSLAARQREETGPRVEVGGHRAGRRCPVVASLMFFAAWAGLIVHAYVTRRQGHQYVLVNGLSGDLSRRWADRTGSAAGSGPDAPRRCARAQLTSLQW